jgi:hypothetical protein
VASRRKRSRRIKWEDKLFPTGFFNAVRGKNAEPKEEEFF